jgi:hypothetical protein
MRRGLVREDMATKPDKGLAGGGGGLKRMRKKETDRSEESHCGDDLKTEENGIRKSSRSALSVETRTKTKFSLSFFLS